MIGRNSVVKNVKKFFWTQFFCFCAFYCIYLCSDLCNFSLCWV